MSRGYHFNEHEKLLLETVYTYDPRPNTAKIGELAEKLAVSESKVSTWFSHKRYNSKKEKAPAEWLHCKFCPSYTCTCT